VSVFGGHEDIANARIAFASGCVANLTASRVSTNKMRRLRFFQRDRYVSIDFQTRQAMVSRRVEGSGPRPTIDVETFQAGDEEPLRLELESFVRAVADGSRPVVSGEDGEAALTLAARVLDAIGQFTQRHSIDEANAAAFGHNPV
jgi:predicted dehydrogenase